MVLTINLWFDGENDSHDFAAKNDYHSCKCSAVVIAVLA